MEVVALLSQGRTAAAQCGLFTHKSVPVIFETPCTFTPGILSHFGLHTYSYAYVVLVDEKNIEHTLLPVSLLVLMRVKHTSIIPV